MEQERKIEKFLKAYAKKRRGQAGGPFTLDPATRRILQNEVSQSAPASEDEGETISLWELLRKHWLYLLGFAACIFVIFRGRRFARDFALQQASRCRMEAKRTFALAAPLFSVGPQPFLDFSFWIH